MKKWLLYSLIFCSVTTWAQDTTAANATASRTINYKSRQRLIGGVTIAAYGGSFIVLSQAWYKDYPRSSFHVFNDDGEWLQMDKIGHAWTAYHTSRLTTNLWRWAGLSENKSILVGDRKRLAVHAFH